MTDPEELIEAARKRAEDALSEFFALSSEGALLVNWVVVMGGYQPEHYEGGVVTNMWLVPPAQPIYTTLGMTDLFSARLRANAAPPVVILRGSDDD